MDGELSAAMGPPDKSRESTILRIKFMASIECLLAVGLFDDDDDDDDDGVTTYCYVLSN